MPFSFALEDAAAAEPETPDHLLLEYAFPPSSPPFTSTTTENSGIADVGYEAHRPVVPTAFNDDEEELGLELELGLDQYDALQDLLLDTMESSDSSSGGEQVDDLTTGGPSGLYELTAMELSGSSDAMMDNGNVNGASDTATLANSGARLLNLIEEGSPESATKRRRRPRAAATKKQLIKATASSNKSVAASTGIVSVNGAKKQLKYNSNKARDERREELLYLRRKVKDLEAQLVELRKDSQPPLLMAAAARDKEEEEQVRLTTTAAALKNPRRKSRTRTRQEESTTMMAPATMSVWHEIASRQHEHRMKAERENIRLKLVLENQLKIAKSLERLLKKTSSTKEFEKCISKSSNPQRVRYTVGCPPVTHAPTDAELFEKLLAGVEQSYKEVDDVFEATGLSRMESSRIDARVQQQQPHSQRDGGNIDGALHQQIELQVFGSKVMPFDMHSTGLAVWNHYVFAKERIPNRLYCHNSPQTMVNSTADTIMENFNVEVDVNNTSVVFCLKLVLRRYIEEDRIVIVWRAFFDPTQVSNEPLSGVRFLEKGYVVVKKHDKTNSAATTGDGDDGENHNLLQTCFISTPVSIGDLMHDPSKVGALTDLVLSTTAANIASSHQMIENVLLEQAMRK